MIQTWTCFIAIALENALGNSKKTMLDWNEIGYMYDDDVNLLGDNIDTIKKNTETFTDASKGGWSRSKHRGN
jgi:hypothetical protein